MCVTSAADAQSAVQNRQIPIIAMTAHTMRGTRERCLKAGMNDFLAKPVSPQTLADAIEKWLTPIADSPSTRASGRATPVTSVRAQRHEVPVFDKVGMMARLMDDEDLAREVLVTDLLDIPAQIDHLRSFLDAGDATGAERQAHSIRSAAANVSGEALCAVALEMEQAGKAGNLDAVRDTLPELEARFARLKTEVERHFGR